jgi:hypothetical protein
MVGASRERGSGASAVGLGASGFCSDAGSGAGLARDSCPDASVVVEGVVSDAAFLPDCSACDARLRAGVSVPSVVRGAGGGAVSPAIDAAVSVSSSGLGDAVCDLVDDCLPLAVPMPVLVLVLVLVSVSVSAGLMIRVRFGRCALSCPSLEAHYRSRTGR